MIRFYFFPAIFFFTSTAQFHIISMAHCLTFLLNTFALYQLCEESNNTVGTSSYVLCVVTLINDRALHIH